MRLMREHIGVDVDSIDEDQLMSRGPIADADEIETWDPDHEQEDGTIGRGITQVKRRPARDRLLRTLETTVSSGERGSARMRLMALVTKGMSENAISNVKMVADKVIHPASIMAKSASLAQHAGDNDAEREDFDRAGTRGAGFASSMVPTLEEKTISERNPAATHANGDPLFDVSEEDGQADGGPEEAQVPGYTKEQDTIVDDNKDAQGRGVPKVQGSPHDKEMYGAPANAHEDDDQPPTRGTKRSDGSEQEAKAVAARKVLRKHLAAKVGLSPWTMPTPTPKINPNRFHDPLDERFWKDMWVAAAVHNTEIFRKVFRCVPDDLVTSWASYKAFANHAEKHNRAPGDVAAPGSTEPPKVVHDGPGTHAAGGGGSGGGVVGGGSEKGHDLTETRSGDITDGKPNDLPTSPRSAFSMGRSPGSESVSTFSSTDQGRKASGADAAWHDWEREEMEELLGEVRGHLGEWEIPV